MSKIFVSLVMTLLLVGVSFMGFIAIANFSMMYPVAVCMAVVGVGIIGITLCMYELLFPRQTKSQRGRSVKHGKR